VQARCQQAGGVPPGQMLAWADGRSMQRCCDEMGSYHSNLESSFKRLEFMSVTTPSFDLTTQGQWRQGLYIDS
jgi:hypothetical protein